jgi:hypothetical protein
MGKQPHFDLRIICRDELMAVARDKSPADLPAASVPFDQFLSQRLSSLDVDVRPPALDAVIENNQCSVQIAKR